MILKKTVSNKVDKPFLNEQVRVKETGNVIELMCMKHVNRTCFIRKLDNDHYIDIRTGELKEANHIENRSQNMNSVRNSLARLRDLINANVVNVLNCRWVTLTYAQPDGKPMTDTVRLYKDFEHYIKRLHRRYGSFEYIVAMEPQGSGSWHAHVILIFPSKAPYIPNDEMSSIWGQGFTVTKRLDNVDNVGAYLTAYLGDMEMEEFFYSFPSVRYTDGIKEVEIEVNGQKKIKRYVKGGRLYFYPPNFNLYRCSRGCKKPVVSYMTEKRAEEKVSSAKLTFQRSVYLEDDETGKNNSITYRYYNFSRK